MRQSDFPTFDSIVTTYDAILASGLNPQIRAAAESWYANANLFANRLCDMRPDWTLEQSASVISALSPRERWESNKAKALRFAQGLEIRGLGMNIRRAHNAARDGFMALRGRKILAFALAIVGSPDAVVIDTWMLKPLNWCSVTPAQYDIVCAAVATVAAKYRLTPRDAQAAIWIITRGAAE